MNITELTVHELKDKLASKELTVSEITKAYVDRINEKESEVGAFVTTYCDEAISKAKEIEEKVNSGEIKGELAGIPIGIKDNINVKGAKTTCSSKMLENFVSPYDATVTEKLNAENLINLGKLNMDEFAMGGSTEHSAFHNTQNPWNLNCVPGGSSGGSAAAVAAGMVPWALGSDTGGSIRQPASFCGVVGLKPTYGLVSRYGLVAFASSLDQIGPITKDVEDCAMLLNIITGHDEKDTTSENIEKVDYTKVLKNDVKGLRIGVPKEFYAEGINEEVKAKLEEAIAKYKELGAEVEEFSLDVAKYSLASYYIIACAEASSNLGRFDGIRYGYRTENYTNLRELFRNSRSEGFGEEVKRRIMLGTYVLSSGYYDAYYKKAQQVRTLVRSEFNKAFEKYDVIITPTSPVVAFETGSKSNNPLEMYLADICTVSVNIAGLPGISIPCGVDSNGMPVGMQIIGNRFEESTILNAAYTYEQATKFRDNYKPEFKGGAE
ncbi:MAG: Asp-tRNA(Asn)/Glu-tRNA(Gln) amidotransferase subunit GatA [Clostridia bacterium]|nr:Asp-tRNA(Asn)/Glu-tRNA(Gln) amidotransferase subunit GatA [Clostridia bacterium]